MYLKFNTVTYDLHIKYFKSTFKPLEFPNFFSPKYCFRCDKYIQWIFYAAKGCQLTFPYTVLLEHEMCTFDG